MSSQGGMPSALEQQRRRLMLEREKMRSKSRSKSTGETKVLQVPGPTKQQTVLSQADADRPPSRTPSISKDSDRSSEAHERKSRGSVEGAKAKSAWNRIKTIDVKREMAENIVIQVQESPIDTPCLLLDTQFDVTVQLRDTSWRIKRSIKEYRALFLPVKISIDMTLPDLASETPEHIHENFQTALQSAARLFDTWSVEAFVDFFDNRFGFVALMLHAKHLQDRVQTLEDTHETTKAQLKVCQDTVGKQQVLLNSFQKVAPPPTQPEESLPLTLICEPPKDSSAFSSVVWENASNSMFSASRTNAALTPKCNWVPSNDLPCAADLRLNRVMTLLCPTLEAVNHRRNVFEYVAGIVKKTIPGAQVFMVSTSATHLFIPDCMLRVGVFFAPDHPDASQWYMKVNEALCLASASAQDPSPSEALHVQHVELVNVTKPRLHCNVGRVVAELSANAFSEIRGSYFLEDIDKRIGKNHLFKRSVLLANGWLLYESGSPDALVATYTVAIMMLYVFNLHHATLHQPLQAVARFFGLFAAFSWDGFCLSVEGPRDILCLTNPPLPSQTSLLVTEEMLEVHRTRALEPSIEPPSITSTHDSILQFNIKYINIMDPVDPSRNLGDVISAKQATAFRHALELGATKFEAIMTAIKREMTSTISTSLGSTSSVSLVESSFRGISQRFQCGWRPDNALFDQPECTLADDLMHSLSSLDSSKRWDASPSFDVLTVCHESLRHDVLVCDFLLNAHVTAPALYSMATEILAERGPLPIGEIGKCLQDITSNSTLSAVLKEKFGGLKKFLEQYPSVFLINTDHPFNPKVYLHRMLSESCAAQVLDGTMDCIKKKKTKPTRKKKVDNDNRSISLAVLPSHDSKRAPPPPGFGFPTSQRSLSFESSLKLSAAAFYPADHRRSID
ncbi:unnamed protein product [Aphanomyces euteiches]